MNKQVASGIHSGMCTNTLLPTTGLLHLEHLASQPGLITLVVSACQPQANCPLCGQASQRVHSRYLRTLADLPWQGVAVHFKLTTRRFFCDNAYCKRSIFTERLPRVVARYARRTDRLADALRLIGHALGGEAGARLAQNLGLIVSPDTLLRHLRHIMPAPVQAPRVLGVDDWAFCKGRHYGTILVDLERHRPIDLLPDREAASLSHWLKAHPGVEIMSRDRACAYSEGARTGAPHAVQVADRWHLLRNVAQTLDQRLGKEAHVIREAAYAVQPSPSGCYAPNSNERLKQATHAKHQDRYDRLQKLLIEQPEKSRQDLAKRAGVGRTTLYRWQSLEALPPHKGMPRRDRLIDPFTDYLQQRWSEGCHNGAQLLREIQAQGFLGTNSMVTYLIREWRVPLRERKAQQRRWVPSPGATKWLLLRSPAKRHAQEQAFVEELLRRAPPVLQTQQLVLCFFSLLRERGQHSKDGEKRLEEWFKTVEESGLSELKQCVQGMKKDKAAIVAAIEQPYSNGQTEGQINRLKLIKRSMYGRANLDLLRVRVLPFDQTA